MPSKYPQFRVNQWIDTSAKAMRRRQATILFGIQAKTSQSGKWMNVCKGREPLFYKTLEDASAACDELRKTLVGVVSVKETL